MAKHKIPYERRKGLHRLKTGGDCWCEPKIEIEEDGTKIITHEDENG